MPYSAISFNTSGLATTTSPGLVGTGAQTFAGKKTLDGGALIKGDTTGNPVAAGYVGEFKYAYATSGVSLANSAWTNVNVIQLTDGVWQIWGNTSYVWSGVTFSTVDFTSGWSQTSASATGRRDYITFFGNFGWAASAFTAAGSLQVSLAPCVVRVSGNTLTFVDGQSLTLTNQLIYHKAYANFGGASPTMTAYGSFNALRIA